MKLVLKLIAPKVLIIPVRDYENGNMGHRPGVKGGYFPVPPVDGAQDMRGEFLKALKDMGIKVEKHHHEVAPSQHELGMYFGTLD